MRVSILNAIIWAADDKELDQITKDVETALSIQPKDITVDDTGLQIASFSYYDGEEFARLMRLEHSTSFADIRESIGYVVCCGDVMARVEDDDYPLITRRRI